MLQSRSNHTTQEEKDALLSYHQSVMGKAWLGTLAYNASTAPLPIQDHPKSGSSMLTTCMDLLKDDTGGVDTLTQALAQEVVALNNAVSSEPQSQLVNSALALDLTPLLHVLDLQNADSTMKTLLLNTLKTYLTEHECADDASFRQMLNSVQTYQA